MASTLAIHNILQWNCLSIRARKLDLQLLLQQHCISLCALSETWLRNSIPFNISGYNFIRADRADGYGGVGILIRKNIVYDEIILDLEGSNLEACAIQISYKQCPMTVVSVYRPPNQLVTSNDLQRLFNQLSQPMIVLGDYNAHHVDWGCPATDSLGKRLLEIAEVENLVLLNDGTPTRISRPHEAPSAVDVTFATPSISLDISWKVLQDSYGSDHLPILLSFKNTRTASQTIYPTYRWNIRRADWESYRTNIDILLQDFRESEDLNSDYERFCDSINSAASFAIPQNRIRIVRRHSTPWWDSECQTALLERRDALKRYKFNASEANYLHFLKTQARAKRLFKSKKRQNWHQYCSSLNAATQTADVWRNIRGFRNSIALISPLLVHCLLRKILCGHWPLPQSNWLILLLLNGTMIVIHYFAPFSYRN